MNKPVIVCDFDDVLFPFVPSLARYFNSAYSAQLSVADFYSYSFDEVFGVDRKEGNRIVEGFLGQDYVDIVPIEGALEAIDQLSKDFQIVLVTARNTLFEAQTIAWLTQHFPELTKKVIFAGNKEDGRGYRPKGEICRELGALLIIDDSPPNVLSAVQVGIDGIVFSDHAWSALDGMPPNVVHCRTWPETVRYIYDEWRHKQLS